MLQDRYLKKLPSIVYRSTLEVYDKTPILIPFNITKDVVELVSWKLSWILGPVGTKSEALQEWLLKSGEDSKRLSIIIEIFRPYSQ